MKRHKVPRKIQSGINIKFIFSKMHPEIWNKQEIKGISQVGEQINVAVIIESLFHFAFS